MASQNISVVNELRDSSLKNAKQKLERRIDDSRKKFGRRVNPASKEEEYHILQEYRAEIAAIEKRFPDVKKSEKLGGADMRKTELLGAEEPIRTVISPRVETLHQEKKKEDKKAEVREVMAKMPDRIAMRTSAPPISRHIEQPTEVCSLDKGCIASGIRMSHQYKHYPIHNREMAKRY